MTPTEKGKRADALFQGPDTRRVLCEMVANRESDLDDLWEMHEAAKKIADGWYSELEATRKRNAVLERENIKLRELLTFYLGCLTKGHVNCDSCAFAEDVCERGRKVIDWARELGVEVTDG